MSYVKQSPPVTAVRLQEGKAMVRLVGLSLESGSRAGPRDSEQGRGLGILPMGVRSQFGHTLALTQLVFISWFHFPLL